MHPSTPWPWWLGFHAVVLLLLAVDLFWHGKREPSLRFSWLWTGFLALLSLGFAGLIGHAMGREAGLEYLAGYSVESSLSLDNLFVFLLLFRSFGLSPSRQRTALGWGIGGAIVLRAAFIMAGIALLERFHWVSWIFGLMLLAASVQLLRPHQSKATPGWLAPLLRHRGQSLLIVIVAVELTDLLFAVDSIPAVLALSRSPFLVYTSNVAAVVGLRALYFVLAGLLDRIRLLHQGLAALLGFVALKMLTAQWIEIPILLSLGIMAAILLACALGSWWLDRKAQA